MRVLSSAASNSPRFYSAWDDDALVSALESGDENAFAHIYERYWQRLYELTHRKLGSGADAEEVVQDVFVGLWHKRSVAHIHKLDVYLFTAAKYKIIDRIRSRIAHEGYVASAAPRSALADCTTEEMMGAADLSAALAASVGSLPANTQAVFRLSREQYQSVPEIAVRLNLAPKTVEYHLTRALRFLRTRLKDFLVFLLLFSQLPF
ncbi:RNA polymerase, sigma-24 subunit, ECF subfamily [Hymenobacter roseosalivarius DSM 11622]|uniref:RNA polymerase, sigma-24 subunit, ECF subfamily n=1 Tax=Hymenobacter roseosalivarius DSM 11622 TaxID=645990 RepID=A0A1W1W0K0_9BACT|nr:sigma-70 family RNA polymerase sigma factor [Hymenobacter roseosalivarius]SMB99162.1 RNA polymerase, sigma-24 subunit, ECF subfamily [Hymenobacter roseosalivarius DSM 11622]